MLIKTKICNENNKQKKIAYNFSENGIHFHKTKWHVHLSRFPCRAFESHPVLGAFTTPITIWLLHRLRHDMSIKECFPPSRQNLGDVSFSRFRKFCAFRIGERRVVAIIYLYTFHWVSRLGRGCRCGPLWICLLIDLITHPRLFAIHWL